MKQKETQQETMSKEKRVVFFEGKSWYHRTKELQDDLTTKYGKKGGFETPEEAERSYWEYEKRYQKKQRDLQIAKMQKTDVMLGDYLEYWFENIFSPRIETTTRMVGAYTLYNLILPSMEADIKLKYISVEYLDALLERVAKICPSAGNKGRELLSIAMKDAAGDKFISYNPMPETKPYPRAKPKVRVLGKEKLKAFLEAASKNPWYLEILLGLFCGLGNLKLKEKEFTVTEYAVIERNPKTENSYRILRVPKVVMQEVKRRQQLIELRKTDPGIEYKNFDYVCCQENGEPRSLTAMNQALTKICNRNGLANITVHGLRHMFATILIELGVPLFKISGLLGHSSVHTTYEYYCEIMDEQDKIIAFVNNTFVPQQTGTEG